MATATVFMAPHAKSPPHPHHLSLPHSFACLTGYPSHSTLHTTMGGQPYLYTAERFDGDSLPNTFNPKAVTMASLAPLPPPKPKPKGPLINFNRHPDSYLILPYGRTGAKPMSPKTKTVVKWARWVQLVFRVFQLLGAIGVLLCGIFIKGTQNSEGFIIRIPVCYASYTLSDSANRFLSLAWTLAHLSMPYTICFAQLENDRLEAPQATTSLLWCWTPDLSPSMSSLPCYRIGTTTIHRGHAVDGALSFQRRRRRRRCYMRPGLQPLRPLDCTLHHCSSICILLSYSARSRIFHRT